jgi:hypothetical protein
VTLTESVVKDAALGWLADLRYSALHGPETAVDTPGAERKDPGYTLILGQKRPRYRHQAGGSALRGLGGESGRHWVLLSSHERDARATRGMTVSVVRSLLIPRAGRPCHAYHATPPTQPKIPQTFFLIPLDKHTLVRYNTPGCQTGIPPERRVHYPAVQSPILPKPGKRQTGNDRLMPGNQRPGQGHAAEGNGTEDGGRPAWLAAWGTGDA